MLRLLFIVPLLAAVSTTPNRTSGVIYISDDELQSKQAVTKWADQTFRSYSDPRFENFQAEYTDEFIIAYLRSESARKKISKLRRMKKTGKYEGTDEAYEAEKKELEHVSDSLKTMMEQVSPRASHYSIEFWANIETDAGVTVYYRHDLRLDDGFLVTDSEMASYVGRPTPDTKILYK